MTIKYATTDYYWEKRISKLIDASKEVSLWTTNRFKEEYANGSDAYSYDGNTVWSTGQSSDGPIDGDHAIALCDNSTSALIIATLLNREA